MRVRNLLAVCAILLGLLAIFFYDVVFLGKTFKVSTANSQAFPWGVYGQHDNRPGYIPVNGTDASVLEEPIYEFIKQNLWKGILPLWNPHQAGGYPLIGMIQVGMFFPLNLILYLLPQLFAWDAFILSRIFFGGLFAYWLMRTLRMGRIPALTTAMVYMFTGPMTLLQYWVVNVEIITPLLLMGLERFIQRPCRRSMAFVSVAIALTFLGGHPEHIFLVNFVGVAFACYRLWSLRRRIDFKTVLPGLAGGYILGIVLSAVVLLPFLQNFLTEFWHKHAGDVGTTTGEVRRRFLTIAIPHLFQRENLTYDFTFAGWWGGYLGILPISLSFLSLLTKQRKGLNYFFAAVAFMFWAQSYSVPFLNWLGYLPLFSLCRFYIHTPHLVAMMTALTAGMGMRLLIAKKSVYKEGLLFSCLLLLVLSVHLIFPVFFELKPMVALRAVLFTIGVLFIWQLFLWLSANRYISRRNRALVAIALLGLELFLYIHRERPNRYDSFPPVPYIEFLKSRVPKERAYGVYWAFYPNTATGYGVDDVGIFQDFLPLRYVNVINNLVFKDYFKKDLNPPAIRAMPLPDENPFLDVLNLRYLVLPRTGDATASIRVNREESGEIQELSMNLSESTKLIYNRDVKIFERAHAFPRAYIVHRVIFESDEKRSFDFIKRINTQLDKVVLVSAPVNQFVQKVLALTPVTDDSTAEIVRMGPNEVFVKANLSSPGFLVLSEAYHPDWTAFADGKPLRVFAANYYLRSVFLNAGEHEVRFVFKPKSFYAGLGISFLGVLLALILMMTNRKMKTSLSGQAKSGIVYILGILIVLGIIIDGINRYVLKGYLEELPRSTTLEPPGDDRDLPGPASSAGTSPDPARPVGKVTRQTRVVRGTDLILHVYYRDGNEIARQTIFPDGRMESTGQVPDGTIEFYDEYNRTHGTERYENGRKNGSTKTYYSTGALRSQEEYRTGRRHLYQEYFSDGTLRLEIDFRDARPAQNPQDEVGVGKLYYSSGILKYEWNLTNSQKSGYKKSYNQDGSLRSETYYDEYGQVKKNR